MSNQDSGISEPSSAEQGILNASLQVDEQEVADYLRHHPEFFEDKPSLLADLRVPHNAGGAVSLVERQINTLRESNQNRQAQLDGLIQIARDNDRLNSQLHQLTLQLMQAEELEVLLTIIADCLKQDFDADLVAIHLLSSPLSAACSNLPEIVVDVDDFSRQFKRLLSGTKTGGTKIGGTKIGGTRNGAKPYCGRLKTEQLQVLFTNSAEDIGSTALLPLGVGLLAIGSFDRNRFTIGTDTYFLARMAEIITAALGKHLQKVDA